MNVEMMQLYQKEGINPMAGCLPLVLQLPILWGFYNLLSRAIELRGAEWIVYQQISDRILGKIEDGTSLMDVLKHHLPQEEWLNVERAFRKLEWSAYSPSRGPALTYGELKSVCKRVEKRWVL